jgi:hypothetical protein
MEAVEQYENGHHLARPSALARDHHRQGDHEVREHDGRVGDTDGLEPVERQEGEDAHHDHAGRDERGEEQGHPAPLHSVPEEARERAQDRAEEEVPVVAGDRDAQPLHADVGIAAGPAPPAGVRTGDVEGHVDETDGEPRGQGLGDPAQAKPLGDLDPGVVEDHVEEARLFT